MSEKLSPEEFFERARKGEFMGAEVTIVSKSTVFTIEQSELEDDIWGDEVPVWFVGDENHGLWEDHCDRVDHLIVTPKESK